MNRAAWAGKERNSHALQAAKRDPESDRMTNDEIADIETRLLLEGIREVYGYDFTEYNRTSLKRRIHNWLMAYGFSTFSAAQGELLRNRELFVSFLSGITVNFSEMFRDPGFFSEMRKVVVPSLRELSSVKIWHAGSSSGEEAYSMAILLGEEGMRGRFRIYATDINEEALAGAAKGIYPIEEIRILLKIIRPQRVKTLFQITIPPVTATQF